MGVQSPKGPFLKMLHGRLLLDQSRGLLADPSVRHSTIELKAQFTIIYADRFGEHFSCCTGLTFLHILPGGQTPDSHDPPIEPPQSAYALKYRE